MASVQDALKARFSKLKDDALNMLGGLSQGATGVSKFNQRLSNSAGTAFKETFVPTSREFQQSNRQFAQLAKQAPENSARSYVAQGLEGLRSMPGMGLIFRDKVANAPQTVGGKVARLTGASLPAFTTAGVLGGGSIAGSILRATPGIAAQGTIGAGVSKLFGGDPFEGATKGISAYAPIRMVSGITNPLITNTAGRLGQNIVNPATRGVINRGVTGLLSIPEGMIMNRSLGIKNYTPTDALLDVGFGAITGGANRPRVEGIEGNVYALKNENIQQHIKSLEQKIKYLSENGGSKTAIKQYQKAIDNAYREIVQNRKIASKLGMKAGLVGDVKAVKDLDNIEALKNEARKYKSAEEFVKRANTVNPSDRGVYEEYTPTLRAKIPLGDNIQTLDKSIGGNPNDMITVYRGTKGNKINPGDFITTNKQLAKDYAGTGNIVELKVRKGDVIDMVDEAGEEEYLYRPNADKEKFYTTSQLTDIYNQAVETPRIDRTKLTGMQLDTPNAKLKAYQPQKLAQELPQIEKAVGSSDLSRPNVLENEMRSTQARGTTEAGLGQTVDKPSTPAIEDQISMQRAGQVQKINTEPLKVSPKTVSSKGIISPDVASEAMAVQNAVKKKVNLLDYLRTPDRVLEKIGLKKEADLLKQKYNDYLDQLPKEIDRVTSWYNRVKENPGAEKRIFRFLDGQGEQLQGEELKVANEIQNYLKEWADKLDLPYDKRIASYITHIFEQDFIKKEFDPDIAKLITDRVPGSVYDPFLQERLGAKGYVEDAFRALDAYVKRATRKYNMDQALGPLQDSAEKLDLASLKYVTRLGERINMRPTELDELLDNLIKSSPVGYKLGQRPLANISRGVRQMVYRGTLGLNFGSAVRNLTQGVNTYAQLGEKYTAIGYTKALKSIMSRDDELQRVGVLRDNMVQDRALSATKKFWEKLDKRLFTFFEIAEKMNRGSSYFGAKSKALSQGLSEEEAVKRGVEMARKTQFTFGSVDTPVALQSDLSKLVTQFQSFNVKQTEFLAEMAKNKEYAGLIRWLGANTVILYTIGQAMGWDWKDFVPFGEAIGGERPIGITPPVQLATDLGKMAMGGTDKFGQPIQSDTILKDLVPFVPAGVQIKKTWEGANAYNQGYSASKTGLVRYPIEKNVPNALRTTLFGQYNTPEAREYFNKERTPLSKKQSEVFKQQGKPYYDQIMQGRDAKKELNKQKEDIKKELEGETGFNPFGFLNPKEAMASSKMVGDTYYYTSGDGVKEIDLAKYTKKPTNEIDRIRQDADKFAEAVKIYRNADIYKEDKSKLFGVLGIKPTDIAYYDIASDTAEVRRSAIDMVMQRPYQNRTEMLTALSAMRYEIASGKRILTDTTIDELYNDGLISYAEKKSLKDIKFTKGKQPYKKSAKSSAGRKPKLPQIKIQQIKAPNVQQLKSIQLGNIAPRNTAQMPRINLDAFKVQTKPMELRLDPRIRAGM